ncbi:MAG: hypothetical protein C0608_12110 [Deltaproteobacteria bacterium]|nr:MAG: hypothetical protein C0608_12110 [Deltaproteobacteria bacterium]
MTKAGSLVAADTGKDHLVYYDAFNGRWDKTVGLPDGEGHLEFDEPSGLTEDRMERLWVSDSGNDRLVVLDPHGSVVSIFSDRGRRKGELKNPGGLADSTNGRLYVVDRDNERVQVFSNRGLFLDEWGKRSVKSKRLIKHPIDIAYSDDDRGSVWILQSGRETLDRFDLDGGWEESVDLKALIGDELDIAGISCDSRFGWLFALDKKGNRVIVVNSRREVASIIEMPAGSKATCLVADEKRGVYVGDSANSRILYFAKR